MKKSELIAKIKNTKPHTLSRLLVGDVVVYHKAEHLVTRVNDCRAAIVPLAHLGAPAENISPESELPLVNRLGAAGAVALLEAKTPAPRTPRPRSKAESNDEPKLGKLGGYLGHTVVSVIRTLGKAGWDFKATREAFDRVNVPAADQTIRIQLKAGRDGNGAQAELTKSELATLAGPPAAAPKAPRKSKVIAIRADAPATDSAPVAKAA